MQGWLARLLSAHIKHVCRLSDDRSNLSKSGVLIGKAVIDMAKGFAL